MPSGAIYLRPRSRGIALMMVIAVVALASMLGYVMLASASLQNRAGANQSKLVSADYLAESGLNIALYYLEHPDRAPARNAEGYWAGMNAAYTLPNGSPSTLSVSVVRDPNDPWTYEIVAAAAVGADDDPSHRVSRTTGARVYVRNEFEMKPGAAISNNSVTYNGPITTNGDVYSSKGMAMKVGTSTPVVNGAGYSQSATTGVGWATPRDGYRALTNTASGAPIAPTNSDVNRYTTYEYEDEQYNAEQVGLLNTILNGLLGLITKEPTSSNPAGVIYKDGSYELGDNVTIEGTLVVEGDLKINGSNITINPEPGFPALIVTGNLEIVDSGRSLTSNGLTYVGNQLKSSAPLIATTPSTFTVNGGLIFGTTSASPIASGYKVRTTLNYNAINARAPELSSALRTATGVNVVRWGLP